MLLIRKVTDFGESGLDLGQAGMIFGRKKEKKMTLEQTIAQIPIFEGLTAEQYRQLSAISGRRTYERGEMVFSEGEEASGFYSVVQGRIKIFKLSPDGKEQILHLFGPGEPFGEVAVFSGGLFPAYAQALEKSEILYIPRTAFIDLIRKNPDMCLSILGVLSMRLRRFARLIEDLSLKEVPGRLAAYLLVQAERQGTDDLELDITKTQLAGLLGTIPETLSRILGRLGRAGLIETEGKRIKILDRDGLDDLAGLGG